MKGFMMRFLIGLAIGAVGAIIAVAVGMCFIGKGLILVLIPFSFSF